MKKLTLGDFKRLGGPGSFAHYFSYKNDKYEVCLESCLGGYCVGIYDLNKNLIGDKTCTKIDLMLEAQIMPGFSMLTGEAIEKALKIANKKLTKSLI